MFESDNRANILTGSLIRSSAAASQAQQRARNADETATGMAVVGMGLAAIVEKERQELAEARARIAELELALLVKTAHAEGLTARVKGFIAAHPDSPERRDTGKRYKDGDTKTVGIARYEAAFDAFLRDKGIATPTKHRAD